MKQPTHALSAPAPHSSLFWRLISQAVILTAFVIVVLTTLSFIISRSMLERSVRSQLVSVSSIAENALESILSGHRERASLLSDNGDIRAIIAGSADTETLPRLFASLQSEQDALLGIEVYDEKGQLLAVAGESIGLPAQARRMHFHRPVITETGWQYYDVFTPVWAKSGEKIGYIAMRNSARLALAPILAVTPSLGETAEVIFALRLGDELQIIHPGITPEDSYLLSLGKFDEISTDNVMRRTLGGAEGVKRTEDYRGRDSLIAYRYLPTLGWSLSLQVERAAALEEVHDLALAHAAIGTLLLFLAAALAWLLANQVTSPLRLLTEHVRHLRPGAWTIKRSVHTDDEVEVLDRVVVDMATRLKNVYEKQEETIEERTSELKKQFALDRAILESVEFGVITVDRTGVITGVNPAAAQLLDILAESMIGKGVDKTVEICGHRGDPLTGAHPVSQCLETRKPMRSPVNAHFNMRKKDESLLPVMYAVSPLMSEQTLFGAILVFQDITEERRLDYLKSEFISLASHQLRTPLSALRWYVELFGEEKKNLTKDQRGYLGEMETSISRMVALLTSLLHAAHLEGDNLAPEMQKVDVTAIMREVEQDCLSLAHEAGLGCSMAVPHKQVMMQTDPTLLRIVMQNLLSNAVKYSHKDSKETIALELKETVKDITITVKDSGMGIPASEQPRVFQKFFRARNVRKQDTDGNGLGLYITRTIIERLGGTIAFTSEENKGTVFTVNLPKSIKKKA